MGASLVLPSLLCAHLLAEAGGSGPLRVPSWDWEPARGNIQEACLHVPDTHGQLYNNSVVWRNNSRLLFLALHLCRLSAAGAMGSLLRCGRTHRS